MKVLVTGATGLVGSALCRALTDRGDSVVGLTRSPERAAAKAPEVEWHGWDFRQGPPPATAFVGIDAIVNLQGEKINQRWTDEAKRNILESRRDATAALAQTVARLAEKPRVVVSGSAIGYYGDRGDEILSESSDPGPETGFDTRVVIAWEAAAEGFANVGVRLVKLRTGHVLDPAGGLLGQLLTPFRLGVGGPIAGGGQYMSWIHIADEVGLILWALDNEEVSGPLNATAPNPATNREFSKALGRALRRPALLPLPKLALDLVFGVEFAATIAGGQRVRPEKAESMGYRFRHPDLEAALRDLL
jgi:uncharacterized protein (TIGR01777 family)